jgi:hypothetical protein
MSRTRDGFCPIRVTDRTLTAEEEALLASPEGRELADRYPAWGPERILAKLEREGLTESTTTEGRPR